MDFWMQLYQYALGWGLGPSAASLYVNMSIWAWELGQHNPPEIISGRRSWEHNRRLQIQWDSGDRSGLKARPADRSAHLDARAFDIQAPKNVLDFWGWIAHHLDGVRWGGGLQGPRPKPLRRGDRGMESWLIPALIASLLPPMCIAAWRSSSKNGEVTDLLRQLADAQPAASTPDSSTQDLLSRIEGVELRQANMHEECRKYLNKAAVSLSRARKLNGESPAPEAEDDQLFFPDEPSELVPESGPRVSRRELRRQRRSAAG